MITIEDFSGSCENPLKDLFKSVKCIYEKVKKAQYDLESTLQYAKNGEPKPS
jgi:hypothetical protein